METNNHTPRIQLRFALYALSFIAGMNLQACALSPKSETEMTQESKLEKTLLQTTLSGIQRKIVLDPVRHDWYFMDNCELYKNDGCTFRRDGYSRCILIYNRGIPNQATTMRLYTANATERIRIEFFTGSWGRPSQIIDELVTSEEVKAYVDDFRRKDEMLERAGL